MKVTIEKKDLLPKLILANNTAAKKRVGDLPTDHFLIDANEEGTSTVAASNLDSTIRLDVPFTVIEDGIACVPAAKLFNIVKEVSGLITIEVKGGKAKVTAGSSKSSLPCLPSDSFPTFPTIDKGVNVELPAAFLIDAINKTAFSVGLDDTRYTLKGFLFDFHGKVLTVVATDGHRLAKYETPVDFTTELQAIIPFKSAQDIKDLVQGSEAAVALMVGAKQAQITVQGAVYSTQLIGGNYPNYGQVIPKDNGRVLIVDREAFVRALKFVSVIGASTENRAVKLSMDGGKLSLSVKTPDDGTAEDEVACTYTGEPMDVAFNSRFLRDALGAMDAKEATLRLETPTSPALVDGDAGYLNVLMPLRLTD
jgi:DNA polymerase-3 subunit beta